MMRLWQKYNAAKKAYNDETDATKKASKKDAMDAAELAMNKAKRQLDTAQSTFNTCQANLNKVQVPTILPSPRQPTERML